ncbi:hypothetical protein PCE1_004357 [Barthelona sp. PCE]
MPSPTSFMTHQPNLPTVLNPVKQEDNFSPGLPLVAPSSTPMGASPLLQPQGNMEMMQQQQQTNPYQFIVQPISAQNMQGQGQMQGQVQGQMHNQMQGQQPGQMAFMQYPQIVMPQNVQGVQGIQGVQNMQGVQGMQQQQYMPMFMGQQSQQHIQAMKRTSSSPSYPQPAKKGYSPKKQRKRLVWTPELHKKFVDSVKELGIKTAVPRTILKKMGVNNLTRENVASHLQKYRILARKQHGVDKNNPLEDYMLPREDPLLSKFYAELREKELHTEKYMCRLVLNGVGMSPIIQSPVVGSPQVVFTTAIPNGVGSPLILTPVMTQNMAGSPGANPQPTFIQQPPSMLHPVIGTPTTSVSTPQATQPFPTQNMTNVQHPQSSTILKISIDGGTPPILDM